MALADSNDGGIGTSRTLVDLVLARRERGSVREIEALLQNLYLRQQRNDALRDRGAISQAEAIVPTELARVLVAQLREIEDDFEIEKHSIERLFRSREEMKREADNAWEHLDKVSSEAPRSRARLESKANRLSEEAIKLEEELRAKIRELDAKSSKLKNVHRLIEWAEQHFKELKF